VKFPFELKPIKDERRPGFVMLQAGELVDHPAVVNGFLQRDALACWFLFIINKDGTNIRNFSLDGEEFIMSFSLINIRSSVHLICKPVLQFDFSKWPLPYPEVPDGGLSFRNHPWYAVPRVTVPLDKRSFMVWAPDWERFLMEWNCHANKVLLLMRKIMEQMEIYLPLDVVKSIILRNIQTLPFDLGNCFLAVFEAFVNDLQEGKVTPFLVDSVNMLQIGSNYEAKIEMYHYTASNLLITFKNVKSRALADQVKTGGDNQSCGPDNWITVLHLLFGN